MTKRFYNYVLILFAMLFMAPSLSHACGTNSPSGVAGQIIYNGDYNVPTYCDGTNWIAMKGGMGEYIPNAVEFDGANDYLRTYRGTNTSQITGSLWVYFDNSSRKVLINTVGGVGGFGMDISASDTFSLEFAAVGFGDIDVESSALTKNQWNHILFSFDLNNPTNRHIYINDSPDLAIIDSYVAGNFRLAGVDQDLFARESANDKFDGYIADFWFESGVYIDFSIEANRRKFIDENGNPVYLGADGSLPTGSAPDIFLSGDTDTWHVNKGTSGGFTEYGSLTTATTKPISVQTKIVPDGLMAHWRMDGSDTSVITDSSGNGNHGAMQYNIAGYRENGVINNYRNFVIQSRYNIPTGIANMGNMSKITIAYWAMPETSDNNNKLIFAEDAFQIQNSDFVSGGGNGRLSFRADNWSGTSGWYDVSETFYSDNYNKWTHYAITYDYDVGTGAVPVLYINGNPTTMSVRATPSGSFSASAGSSFYLGRDGGSSSSGFDGGLDDFRIYNRVLTPAEIDEIYNARDGIRYNADHREMEYFDGNGFVSMNPQWPAPASGLVAHYKLDETSGTTMVNAANPGTYDLTMENGLNADDFNRRGPVGDALEFLDVDNNKYATGSYPAGLLNNDFTIAWWMNPKNENNFFHDIMGTRSPSNSGAVVGIWLRANNASLALNIRDMKNSSGDSLSLQIGDNTSDVSRYGEWRHYAVSRALDGTITFYENGSQIHATPSTITGELVNRFDDTPTLSAFSISSGALANNRFSGLMDDFRAYDRVLSAAEIAQLYAMGTPVGSSTALPQGCPNIGDVCDDGTIYVGNSPDPDDTIPMFAAPADAPTTLQARESTGGTAANLAMGDCLATETQTSCDTGQSNTLEMVTTDAATGIGTDFQTHPSGQYCYDLNVAGLDDWYLPAQNELKLVEASKESIGTYADGLYWSSSEVASHSFRLLDFTDGSSAQEDKTNSRNVRCVRKGPAPRCANPYGLEGQMIYNVDEDIVQFCDGARWIGIGKRE